MTTRTTVVAAVATAVIMSLAACGDDDTDSSATTTTGAAATTTTGAAASTTAAVTTTTTAAASTTAAVTTTTATAVTTTTAAPTETTAPAADLEQPAVWPAADVVFDAPEEAAADFVTSALGVPAELGPFQEGDARSGEIEVFSPGEGDGGMPVPRGTLLLRRLGPADGWFVLGATNENATITAPASAAEVPAGPLAVEGVARGFEATVVVSAFVAGDAGTILDEVVTQGGAMETPEPYAVTLDLSAAPPGATVTVLVRGGTGLETDPGEFGAIPVTIAG